ncbi:MAG: Rrf2 family transcriptional regulator [Chromatiaceae bacterium]|jgi:Rrf2 family iron-sulfur cluster assembly transcriptional regulator
MRLSTKSRYAVTAMLDLALNGARGPVTLADISENQSISLSYLEQLFAALRAKGLVRGVRGPGGGYYLGRDAEAISVADVICAVDDWVEYTRSKPQASFTDVQQCTTRALWEDLSEQIFDFLADITLAQLVQRGELRATAVGRGSSAKAPLLGLKDRAA